MINDSQPISEITIIVTEQGELPAELERLGGRVILFPTVKTAPPTDNFAALDAAVRSLANYDWLILDGSDAAEFFLARLAANDLETAELDYLRVCSIGAATFEQMRLARVHVDVVPVDSRPETIFETLLEYVGGAENSQNLRFLLPRSSNERDSLPVKLQTAGAAVDVVTAYQLVLPANPEIGKLKALLAGGAADCVTFISSSSFQNFAQIFAETDLPKLLDGVSIVCATAAVQIIRDNNLQIAIVLEESNPAVFAQKIIDFCSVA